MKFKINNRKNLKEKYLFGIRFLIIFFFTYKGKIEYIKFKILILQKIL